MAEPLLRPRTTTELVDLGFQIYRRHFVPMVTLSALVNIPLIAASMGVAEVFRSLQATLALAPPVPPDATRLSIIALTVATAYAVIYLAVDAALIVGASDLYLHGSLDVRSVLQRVVARMGSLAVASIVRAILIGVGTVLFFVPGLLWYASTFAIPATVVIEDRTAEGGLRRSWQLARDERGRILSALGLVWTVAFVFLIVGAVMPGVILQQIASGLAGILVYPLIAIVTAALYYDIRIRKEGFDIERMAAALETPPGTAP